MPLTVVGLPSAVIAINATDSNAVGALDDALSISIFAPSSLTGTVNLEVEPSSTGTAFVVQQSGGSDVTIPANKATTIANPSFRQFRLVSGSAEAASRTFTVTKTILT